MSKDCRRGAVGWVQGQPEPFSLTGEGSRPALGQPLTGYAMDSQTVQVSVHWTQFSVGSPSEVGARREVRVQVEGGDVPTRVVAYLPGSRPSDLQSTRPRAPGRAGREGRDRPALTLSLRATALAPVAVAAPV